MQTHLAIFALGLLVGASSGALAGKDNPAPLVFEKVAVPPRDLAAIAQDVRARVPEGKVVKQVVRWVPADSSGEGGEPVASYFDTATGTLFLREVFQGGRTMGAPPGTPPIPPRVQMQVHMPEGSAYWMEDMEGQFLSRMTGASSMGNFDQHFLVDRISLLGRVLREQEAAATVAEATGDAQALAEARAELTRLDWSRWDGKPVTVEADGTTEVLEQRADGTYHVVEKTTPLGTETVTATPEGVLLTRETTWAKGSTLVVKQEILDALPPELQTRREKALALLAQPLPELPKKQSLKEMEQSVLRALQDETGERPLGVEITKDGEVVRVKKLMNGGLAEGKLKAGDVIMSLNGTPVKDTKLRQVALEMRKARPLVLEVLRQGEGRPEVVKFRTEPAAEDTSTK